MINLSKNSKFAITALVKDEIKKLADHYHLSYDETLFDVEGNQGHVVQIKEGKLVLAKDQGDTLHFGHPYTEHIMQLNVYDHFGPCFVVKEEDEEALEAFKDVLKNEYDFRTYRPASMTSFPKAPWYFIDIEQKLFKRGIIGVSFAEEYVHRFIKPDAFLDILNIVLKSEAMRK